MAGIFLEVEDDIKKLRELRDEIERTKKSLESIKVTVDIDVSRDLEARLKSLTAEYDTLARKVAENEGQIMLSVKRINDATRQIASIQETVSRPQSQQTHDNAVTDSVARQAKAYDDLKERIDEVMGSRNENINGMIREQDAIRLVNAQIEAINKKQANGHGLASSEQERLKALTATLQEHKIALADFRQRLNSAFKIEHSVPTSMDALSQSLGRMRAAYRALTEDERNSTFGKELLESIQQADAKMKELDATIGNHQRNVGNYPNTRAEMRALTQQVVQLATAYRALSDEEKSGAKGQELRQKLEDTTRKAAALKDTISDMQATISQDANDQAAFQGITQGLNILISGFATAKGAAVELGLSEEDLAEVQTTLQTALAANNFLTEASTAIQKQSALMRGIATLQAMAHAKAVDLETAAKGRGTIATMALTAAQRAFNIVANMNPYVLLATALITVVGAVIGLTAAYQRNREEQEKAAEVAEERKRKLEDERRTEERYAGIVAQNAAKQIVAYNKLRKGWNDLGNNMKAKKKYIQDTQKEVHSLGYFVNNLAQAENFYVKNTAKVVEAITLRAKAAAYEQRITDLTTQKLKEQELIVERYIKSKKGEGINSYDIQWGNLQEGVDYIQDKGKIADYTLTESGAAKMNAKKYRQGKERQDEKRKAIGKKYDDQIDGYVNKLITAQKEVDKTNEAIGTAVWNNPTKNDAPAPQEIAKKAEAYREIHRKNSEERARLISDMERAVADAEIAAWKDGADKIQALKEQERSKELERIDRERDALIQKEKERQQAEYKARMEASGKGGTLNGFAYDDTLEKEIMAQYKRISDYRKQQFNSEDLKAEANAMREYLKEYGTYLQQKAAITEEYDEKINKAITEGDRRLLEVQKTEALDALDEKFGKSAKAMADLFEDASGKSVSAIKAIIDKYELLVKYMSGGGDISAADLEGVGFSDKDLKNIENGTISLKDLTDALRSLKDELKGKSQWRSFTSDMNKAIEKIKNAKGDITKIGEGISVIGDSVSSFAPALKQFSSDVSTIFGADDTKIQKAIDGMEGLSNTAAGVGQAMSGDIVGGVMTAVHGVSQMVSAFDGMFGADYSQYNRMVEQYERLNQIWDELIDKKRRYISESYGAETMKAGKEVEETAKKSIESYRKLGRERLNSGASAGSHSIGVRQSKGMSAEGWKELDAAANAIGFSYDSVASGRMTGLFDLTEKQLERLKEEAPTFWAKLDDDVRNYLDSIIEGAERMEDIQKQLKEQLTQTSFDNVFDSFLENLMDLEYTATEAGKDVSESFMRAMLRNMIGPKYKKQLEDWYEAFYADMSDNSIIDNRDKLLETYAEIFEQAARERDQLAELIGYAGSSSSSQQQGTHKTFEGASQNQVGEANGRMTAIQSNTEQMLGQNEERSRTLSVFDAKLDTLIGAGDEIRDISDEIRDIIAQSYLELVGIRENTEAIVKPIRNMSDRMDSWDRKIMSL